MFVIVNECYNMMDQLLPLSSSGNFTGVSSSGCCGTELVFDVIMVPSCCKFALRCESLLSSCVFMYNSRSATCKHVRIPNRTF